MRRIVGLTCAWLIAVLPVQAQQAVRQSGTVTPGHAAKIVGNGLIGDGGTAANGGITSVGTQGQGDTICANSGPNTGPFARLCLGANTNAASGISLNHYAGATGGFNFNIDGTTYTFPYTIGGILGPNSSTAGHIACWNNGVGTLLSDCTVLPSGTTTTTPGSFITTTQVPTTAWVNTWFLPRANAAVVYAADYITCSGADETTGMASAVAAANGLPLVFPAGKTCVGTLAICSANPCHTYGALAGGSWPTSINLNGSTIRAASSSYPAVYIESANNAKALMFSNGAIDGNYLTGPVFRIYGCNFCTILNVQVGRGNGAGCSFEGAPGYGFYWNLIASVNCGGAYTTGFSLQTKTITASIAPDGAGHGKLSVTVGTGLAVGMGLGDSTDTINSGTWITGTATGCGGGSISCWTVNVSQTVGSESMTAQFLANRGTGLREYTWLDGTGPTCISSTTGLAVTGADPNALAFNASNTFLNVSSQYNLSNGWEVNCAHNTHIGNEAEANLSTGINIQNVYRTFYWAGGYTENNGNSWAGAGATNDNSLYTPDNSKVIEMHGGVHTGSFFGTGFVALGGAQQAELHIPNLTGYGFTSNCNSSGHYCATIP